MRYLSYTHGCSSTVCTLVDTWRYTTRLRLRIPSFALGIWRSVMPVGGCEEYYRAHAMPNRWLPPGRGTATSSTVYIENGTCENTDLSVYLIIYLLR